MRSRDRYHRSQTHILVHDEDHPRTRVHSPLSQVEGMIPDLTTDSSQSHRGTVSQGTRTAETLATPHLRKLLPRMLLHHQPTTQSMVVHPANLDITILQLIMEGTPVILGVATHLHHQPGILSLEGRRHRAIFGQMIRSPMTHEAAILIIETNLIRTRPTELHRDVLTPTFPRTLNALLQ